MPRKPANPKNDTTAKKSTRRKKAAEPVAEAPVEAVAETAPVVEAPADTAAPKKRGRKPKATAEVSAEAPVKKTRTRKPKAVVAETVTEDTTVKKSRGRKAKTETTADAPVKKPRGRKKATPEMVAEVAPPVEAEAAFADAEVTDVTPEMVVEIAEPVVETASVDDPRPGQLSMDGKSDIPVEEAPAKKPRKPRAKKAEKKADVVPKKRGRRPKEPGTVITTTLQIGETEFDISDIAAKALKQYKSVHKRKVVTDFHVYVKPEEGTAYYTVNGEGGEDFKIEL